MSISPVRKDTHHLQSRFSPVVLVIVSFFFLILSRLYYLQILQGDEFRFFAEKNTIKELSIPAPRGRILDRNGLPMVESRKAFNLSVIPQYVKQYPKMKKGLLAYTDVSESLIDDAWKRRGRIAPFHNLEIDHDIGYDNMVRLRARQATFVSDDDTLSLEGIEVLENSVREYPYGDLASNVMGYVREISSSQLKTLQKYLSHSYHMGDRIGHSGLEERWEVFLNGEDGYHQKVVNAVGREVQTDFIREGLTKKFEKKGIDLVTTLDVRLQKRAEELFDGKSGALVGLNPQNGEIYAMVSAASYPVSQLASKVEPSVWKNLSSDPRKLFMNRPIQASYPPGSTYKIVTGLAALEEKVTTTDEKIFCPGYLKFGRRRFRCWKSAGHGWVNLHDAITQSCDVYFYTMGLRVGVDSLARYATELGLGKKTGIGLKGESAGLIPSRAWKKRRRGEDWIEGETLSISIGQGYNLLTPLQNALMIAAVANGGHRIQPKIVRFFRTRDGVEFIPPERHLLDHVFDVEISSESIKVMQKALIDVVAHARGTAHRLSKSSTTIAGKTGTAQVVGYASGLKGAQYRDHAWFTAYAPVDDPAIAVSVIVEHGGHGSSAAAPIAKEFIEEFVRLKGLDQ